MRRLLLGKRKIDSRIEYKYALLRAQIGLLLGSICLIYIFIDTLNGVFAYIPIYVLGMIMSAVVIITNRARRYLLSSIIFLTTAHLLVFVIASIETAQGGVFFYFMTTAAMSLVVLKPHSRTLGYVFVAISIALAAIAFYGDPLLRVPIKDKEYEQISFTVNFLLGLLSSVLILHFVIARNDESESSLMQQQQNLEKINQELDRFVYSASHDMRAPLTTMVGLLNLAARTNDPAEIATLHQMMLERIKTMDGFIREITDYSRNTRLELKLVPVNVRSLLEDICRSFEVLANEAQIKIKVNVSDDLEIITDKDRLSVILNNLVSNAIKYYHDRIPDRYIEARASVSGENCVITIEDNGIGIRPEYRERIFDMFFRASERSVGSGLGLYIAKETVQKLHGTITYSPMEKGYGSSFQVTIPCKKDTEV